MSQASERARVTAALLALLAVAALSPEQPAAEPTGPCTSTGADDSAPTTVAATGAGRLASAVHDGAGADGADGSVVVPVSEAGAAGGANERAGDGSGTGGVVAAAGASVTVKPSVVAVVAAVAAGDAVAA